LLVLLQRGKGWFPSKFKQWARSTFDVTPGANIEHKVERTNAFVTLVFGYSVVAVLYQNRVAFGINAFFGKAVLGLIQAVAFNWLYFEIDSFNLHTHAIRRHFLSGTCLRASTAMQSSQFYANTIQHLCGYLFTYRSP